MNRILTCVLWFLTACTPLAPLAFASPPQKVHSPASTKVIDINRASAEDFEKLPGIGPKLARQIIAYRKKHGPFRRVEDLLIIRGIGSKKWESLQPHLCVGCVTEKSK